MAVFYGTPEWPIDEEIVDLEVDGQVVHLYHEWDLVRVLLSAQRLALTFSRSSGDDGRHVELTFGGLRDVWLATDLEQYPSIAAADELTFQQAFGSMHYMLLAEEMATHSRFEVHFSDKILTLLAKSVTSSWQVSLI